MQQNWTGLGGVKLTDSLIHCCNNTYSISETKEKWAAEKIFRCNTIYTVQQQQQIELVKILTSELILSSSHCIKRQVVLPAQHS
jgi:hypothetical protein